ncbi:helix-turn-helix domain-containing protein [Paenibacillus daejeonensis]|uniref:helix-turn-helix domain-containing protein n=1 Tax=Paenibacillus daejeonensis TaxID=135193 RepID=UPI00037AACC6|nr:helix-turn-helix domain-containing protein [Paenibacillus daejeonensis]
MSIEQMIREIVVEEVAAAEKRIRAEMESVNDETLDVSAAAARLGVSEKLIYRMCQQRIIPHERYGGIGSRRPTIKFRLADLEAWRAAQRVANSSGERSPTHD